MKLPDEIHRGPVKLNDEIDNGNRPNRLKSHRSRQSHAPPSVGHNADNENVTDLGREFEQSQMPRMHDVEYARDERDALATGHTRADLAEDAFWRRSFMGNRSGNPA